MIHHCGIARPEHQAPGCAVRSYNRYYARPAAYLEFLMTSPSFLSATTPVDVHSFPAPLRQSVSPLAAAAAAAPAPVAPIDCLPPAPLRLPVSTASPSRLPVLRHLPVSSSGASSPSLLPVPRRLPVSTSSSPPAMPHRAQVTQASRQRRRDPVPHTPSRIRRDRRPQPPTGGGCHSLIPGRQPFVPPHRVVGPLRPILGASAGVKPKRCVHFGEVSVVEIDRWVDTRIHIFSGW
ncbi:hypothetical protein P168DRAFT_191893 [Aspergillus campestris IBT 28561]|uniref:Uncharacterized protein n=1 Tax=Aspergillus campestris (strain IBT 28561) TaxID=1392248 RepID=A0A2I1CYX2_ASPC2|nr:uncharacterized protein P168DRAFT_191893 [Aspergillus campestris IBT 28561]PKY02811.1 hypothetical protein P168DRAFT_191893 [Aspergillus campestris IBT 28561]